MVAIDMKSINSPFIEQGIMKKREYGFKPRGTASSMAFVSMKRYRQKNSPHMEK
jgi:hypothetical protein